MQRAIAFLLAASLTLVVVPTAAANHDDTSGLRVCGAYEYDGQRGEDTTGAEVGVFNQEIHWPDHFEIVEAGGALAADVADGDAAEDDDGAPWDVGPDPFDGNGYLHVVVVHEGETAYSVGTDDTNEDWSADC